MPSEEHYNNVIIESLNANGTPEVSLGTGLSERLPLQQAVTIFQ